MSLRNRRTLGLVIVLVGLAALAVLSPLRELLFSLAAWFRSAGAVGIAVYLALYTLSALVVLPASGFTLLAGFSYGLSHGMAVALPAATIAAAVNFWFARGLGRERVERALSPQSSWRIVLSAASEHGFRWVLLLRLSPVVPFAVLNYLMGASRVRFSHFIVASTLGKMPSLVVFVYLGSAAQQLSTDVDRGNVASRVLFWVGLAATLIAATQITRVVRRHANQLLKNAP